MKARISHSEFLEWLQFLRLWERRTTKQDVYMAMIAAEARRGWVDTPKKVSLNDFLLVDQEVKEEREERIRKSKAAWGAHFGLNLN